jgi:hypothetical protein
MNLGGGTGRLVKGALVGSRLHKATLRGCCAKGRVPQGLDDGVVYVSILRRLFSRQEQGFHMIRLRPMSWHVVLSMLSRRKEGDRTPRQPVPRVHGKHVEETRGLTETGDQTVRCWLAMHLGISRTREANWITASPRYCSAPCSKQMHEAAPAHIDYSLLATPPAARCRNQDRRTLSLGYLVIPTLLVQRCLREASLVLRAQVIRDGG